MNRKIDMDSRQNLLIRNIKSLVERMTNRLLKLMLQKKPFIVGR